MTSDLARRGGWSARKARAASERGRARAKVRWDRDRARRDRLAAADPISTGRTIVRRIVVIDNETTVREATIYSDDSYREARRKLRQVLTAAPL